jgi:hypothetical protein
MREAAASLWPYYAAEELFELLGEAGWQVDPEAGGYVPIPQFNAAVLSGRLGFKGFGRVFDQLRAQGYDPMEVGWGEVRFGARLDPNVA